MKRRLLVGALVVAVFAIVGALTFPTDAVVRAVLARAPLPNGMQLAFASAHLRPDGLRLDGVRVVGPDGESGFDADWIRLRPSLWGLWRDGTGRPWRVGAATCQGVVDVTIGQDRGATTVAVSLAHVEIASCLSYLRRDVDAYGRVEGTFDVRLPADAAASGAGDLQLRGAAWRPGGLLEDARLRADAGAIAWRLGDRRLEVTTLQATSTDFAVRGTGVVRVLGGIDESALDLRLTVTPGTTMPPVLRRYVEAAGGTPADTRGTRTFRVQGTVREPRVVAGAGAVAP